MVVLLVVSTLRLSKAVAGLIVRLPLRPFARDFAVHLYDYLRRVVAAVKLQKVVVGQLQRLLQQREWFAVAHWHLVGLLCLVTFTVAVDAVVAVVQKRRLVGWHFVPLGALSVFVVVASCLVVFA